MQLSDQQVQTLKTKRLGILCGGRSLEHEVSLVSARWVLEAAQAAGIKTTLFWLSKENCWHRVSDQASFLQDPQQVAGLELQPITPVLADSSKQWQSLNNEKSGCLDIVFPVMHGLDGEDGPMQGLCQFWGLPFIGPNLRDAVFSMNKRVTKDLLEKANIPLVPWFLLMRDLDADHIQLAEDFEFPVFVKVSNGGSSIGVYKVNNQQEFSIAVNKVWALDRDCLVEQAIAGQEIEVAALIGDTIEISDPGELEVFSDYYDYRSKYLDKGASKPHVVANLTDNLKQDIKATAEKVCKVLGCECLARIDFFVDKQGRFYVNEVNPIPGFTPISLFPVLWQQAGLDAKQLLFKLMQTGFERYAQKDIVLNQMRQIAQEAISDE